MRKHLCALWPRLAAALAALGAWSIAPVACDDGEDGRPDGLPPEIVLVQAASDAYPTRSAFFLGGHGAHAGHTHCRRPARDVACGDYLLFAKVGAVAVGDTLDVGLDVRTTDEHWENMGFAAVAPGRWRRIAPLDEVATLVPTVAPELPAVDAIAITSIDRRNGQRPYIYETLKSLFSVLPDGAQVNIMVGSHDTAYLSDDALLAEGIAPHLLGRIHLHPPHPATARFLADTFANSVRRRASWNYARTLRSYAGKGSLLLLEDDVAWADDALAHFRRAQADDPLPVTSLFDHACAALPEALREDYRAGRQLPKVRRPAMRHVRFFCTQAMVYSADVANELGRFLQPRMHEQGYDEMIDRFMHHHGVQLGYAQPSLVQHTGIDSTGLSVWIPMSKCFVPELPQMGW